MEGLHILMLLAMTQEENEITHYPPSETVKSSLQEDKLRGLPTKKAELNIRHFEDLDGILNIDGALYGKEEGLKFTSLNGRKIFLAARIGDIPATIFVIRNYS